jgi:hypothetical protein
MEWSRLYASLPDNPRVQAAEDNGGAGWLLMQSFCYCTSAESGGFIPNTQVPRFGGPRLRQRVLALAREGLWTAAEGGYLLDPEIWSEERNLSDSAEKKKQADRERIAAKRAAAKAGQDGKPGDVSRDSSATSRTTRPATSSRDSRTVDQSQIRSDQNPVVDVSDQSSGRNAREDPQPLRAVSDLADRYGHVLDDDDLLRTVIRTINTRTGRVIDGATARGIAASILGSAKRHVGEPKPYIRKAIEQEKNPVARWLDQPESYQATMPMLVAMDGGAAGHPFQASADDPRTCRCGLPEGNKRHLEAS